jgi:curved DNA-binding protein CbpA
MSKIEIDFNNLKYNLYEILNVSPSSESSKIKKSFLKLIKTFHPDKNSELEEDIYQHIILANQILTSESTRKKYDSYLLDKAENFIEMRESFNKTIKNMDTVFPSEDISKNRFTEINEQLNKKHGYTDNSVSVMDRYNQLKTKRKTNDIIIDKEDIKTPDDFNSKFNSNMVDGKFNNMIVEYKGLPNELSTYVVGENFTNLADLDKLYIEDSVQCSKYSSLDRAFTLQPITNNNIDNMKKTIEDRMKDYKQQTESLISLKPTEYSTRKFNEWV